MEKNLVISIIFVMIIVLGFVIAALLPSAGMCTAMGCPCEGVLGERPCNSCTQSDPIFTIGLLNIILGCSGTEIITCENDEQVDRRIDINPEDCNYALYILFFRV